MNAPAIDLPDLTGLDVPSSGRAGTPRFVDSAGVRWHVRCEGSGPVLLLLHGAGSSGASWRGLIAPLAQRFTVVAPDLPGHGLSSRVARAPSSLPVIAHALAELMRNLELVPDFIVGHSAGAAISAQMALAEVPTVRRLGWIAGALSPLGGVAGAVATPLARLLSHSAWLPQVAAWHARSQGAVRRLIDATGSTLDERGIEAYGELLRRPTHVAGTLAMMAHWDLAPLGRALHLISAPVLLLHGELDRTVPVRQSDALAARLPRARVIRLAGLGHLAHEERPQQAARLLVDWLGQADAPGDTL